LKPPPARARKLKVGKEHKKLALPRPAPYNLTNWLIKTMPTATVKARLGSRGRPEQSRAAILKAAVIEFSREGVAGARTDAIARAAKVNKALLYYYFKDKEALYGAVLDQVFGGLTLAVNAAFALGLPPRETILAYAGAHFDYIASHPLYPRIVQGEMMRASRGGSPQLNRIVKQYFRPLFLSLAQILREGIASGEFRAVDPMQFVPSMISIIVFYFTNMPVTRLMSGSDPMDPEHIEARRTAVLDFISAALFQRRAEPRQGASR
jgi:AcrR family transcriptional regulator